MPSLRASSQGLLQIRQRRKTSGRAIEDSYWLSAASQILDASTSWTSQAFAEKGIFAPGVSLSTWKRFLRGEAINTRVFKAFCQLLELNWQVVADQKVSEAFSITERQGAETEKFSYVDASSHQDWGEAPDVSLFYGRVDELSDLENWIVRDQCRLVAVLGMGGIGKTSLLAKLIKQLVADQQSLANVSPFQYVIWRSLRDAPPLDELLIELIQFVSQQEETQLPDGVGAKLSCLVKWLQRWRCLIILDNFETVLQGGERAGTYRDGYQMYGELLRRVGETAHESCLLLTSREKPQEVGTLEGARLAVRTLPLVGLDIKAGQHILDDKGLQGAVADLEELVAHYQGNPLALKMAATSIHDLFAGDIARFLGQNTAAFSNIGSLLKQQCERLSKLEQTIMNWLAINREPVTLADLQADLVTQLPRPTLLEVLESLRWRSLIENSVAGFTLQPVVMESVTASFIEQVANEIVAEQPQLFLVHALIKAQVKDFIRDSQIRVILQPLIERLLTQLGSPKQLTHKLNRLLMQLRTNFVHQPNYGAGNLLNLFRQLETDLTGYDFSGLSIQQAYLQDVSLHYVNFSEVEFVNCAFASILGGVTTVAFDPSGQHLATCDTNGGVQIWSLTDGRQLALCSGHNSWVWSVAYSPSQPMLASCGQDHQVRLWNSQTGQCLKRLEGHTGIATSVAFSPDGQWIASTSGDHTIRLWHIATGKCVHTLRGHAACVWGAVFHPDSKTLFSVGEDNVIRRWNIESGERVQTLTGHLHWIRTIAISPDGQLLASGSYDQTLKLWDVATGACLATLSGHHKPVTSVAFSCDGKTLASSSYDQTVKLWCVASLQCLQTLQKHTNSVRSVAFHPSQPILASGGEDYTARLWDMSTGQCTKTLQGYSNSIYAIALSAPHSLLASGHEDQTIKLWDCDLTSLTNAAPCAPFRTLRGHTGRVISVAFSPDHQVLASTSTDGTVRLWNPNTGQCLQTLHGHASWAWAVAFHPNSQQVASASYDHTVKLWDVKTGECLHTFQEHTSSVLALAFSPDGKWLASGSYGQTIKLWNLKTWQSLHTLQAHLNRVWAVVFSPDSRYLATGGDDFRVNLWDVETGECIKTFEGHTSQVLSLLFDAHGTHLISSSADKSIRVWDIATGECIALFQGHQHWIWSLAYHKDAEILLSSSQDQTIQAWQFRTGTQLKTLRCPRPYEGSIITQAAGLTEAQQVTLETLGAVREDGWIKGETAPT